MSQPVSAQQNIRQAQAVIDLAALDVVAPLQQIAASAEKPADRRKALNVLRSHGLEPWSASPGGR